MSAMTTTNPARVRKFGQISAVVGGLMTRYKKHRLYRRTTAELESLTDRELLDFGINRIAIYQVAHESVYGM